MPKKAVVEFECDRCGRTWYADAGTEATHSLTLKLTDAAGQVVEEAAYQVLCEGCAKSCANYVDSIVKELKKSSPKRGAKGEEAAASGTPAPRTSPPPAAKPPTSSGTSSPSPLPGTSGGGKHEAPSRTK